MDLVLRFDVEYTRILTTGTTTTARRVVRWATISLRILTRLPRMQFILKDSSVVLDNTCLAETFLSQRDGRELDS